MFTMAKAKFGEGERTVEVLVVGNTAYVDDDFCAKAFPGDHVQVVAANEARRDGSSLHASWKELLQHLDQAYEFDRVVYLSTYLTPHTEAVGDIELLRSVFRACMGRQIQLLFVTGPMGADATTPMSNPFMIKSNVLTGSNHIIGAKLAFFHETIKKRPFFFYFS